MDHSLAKNLIADKHVDISLIFDGIKELTRVIKHIYVKILKVKRQFRAVLDSIERKKERKTEGQKDRKK